MTINETTSAADAITAALVQGLHAFMASEAKAAATDTALEDAAKGRTGTPSNYTTCSGSGRMRCS